jgi:hypothetical protein
LKVSMHAPMIPSEAPPHTPPWVQRLVARFAGEGPAKSRACRCSCRRPLECRP